MRKHTEVCIHSLCLTWALFDAEGSICVFGPWVVLQLERGGVVDEGLWALRHTCTAVVEVSAGLDTRKQGY